MLTYKGGQKVGNGTYWDIVSGRRIDVAGEAMLVGGSAATYVRMSSGVALLSMPLIGLLYVIVMPFVGIAATATIAIAGALGGVADGIGKAVTFGWRPRSAYLAGKKHRRQNSR